MDIRKNTIEKFSNFLTRDKAENLENCIFNYISKKTFENGYVSDIKNKNFRLFYNNKFITLYTNLDPESYINNNFLLEKVINNEIELEKLVTLKNHELYPENWKENIKIQELLDKEIFESTEQAVSNLFKCRYCIKKGVKEPTCTYVSVQTRSADEPATNFVTCVKCNKSWRD